jgi:hypothetical protein
MIFEGMTTFAKASPEQAKFGNARKLVDERGAAPRKHFLAAYAEHLEALKQDRPSR